MIPDAAIVGAGLIGAAIADRLTEAGLNVAIYDAGLPPSGATAAGMGHVAVMDDSPAQFNLCRHSQARWMALTKEFPKMEAHPCGSIWFAMDQEEMDHVVAKEAVYREGGVRAEVLDSNELKAREPGLHPDAIGGLYLPDDFVVYQPRACQCLLDRAVGRGAKLHLNHPIRSLRELKAGTVILATGWSPSLLPLEIKLQPRRGHLLITERTDFLCHSQLIELGYLKSAHSMSAESIAFNIQPRGNGQYLIGSSRELGRSDPHLNHALIQRMLERALHFVPGLSGVSVIRTWTGIRPTSPDHLPYIGSWRPGLMLAVGHEGLGITTSLGTADLIAAEILGEAPPIDSSPFSPRRVLEAA